MITARNWREIPQRYRLEAAKCAKCGNVSFHPRLACGECRGRKFETVTLPDKGKVLTFTVVRTGPDRFSDLSPYVLAIVELENGVRLTAQVADCKPEEAKTGMPVRIEFRKIHAEGRSGIIFYGYKFVAQ